MAEPPPVHALALRRVRQRVGARSLQAEVPVRMRQGDRIYTQGHAIVTARAQDAARGGTAREAIRDAQEHQRECVSGAGSVHAGVGEVSTADS